MAIALNHRNDPGGRIVALGTHKAIPFEIVYGYNIAEDNWLMHVYIDGMKVDLPAQRASSADHAEQKGLELVLQRLGA
jgi:hypothetical protein